MNPTQKQVDKCFQNLLKIKIALQTEPIQKKNYISKTVSCDYNLVRILCNHGIVKYSDEADSYIWNEHIPITETLAHTICVKLMEAYSAYKAQPTKLRRKQKVEIEEPDMKTVGYSFLAAGLVTITGLLLASLFIYLIFNK